MAEAFVTPHLLTWARQRRGLEVEDLAKKLNVKPDAVNAWEAGERRPTFRQAQNFAQASYVPFGYLYLADPPVQELPLPDFRTIPGQPPRDGPFSPVVDRFGIRPSKTRPMRLLGNQVSTFWP